MKKLAILAAFGLVTASFAAPAADTGETAVSLTIQPYIDIQMPTSMSETVVNPTLDFLNSFTFKVIANVPYNVTGGLTAITTGAPAGTWWYDGVNSRTTIAGTVHDAGLVFYDDDLFAAAPGTYQYKLVLTATQF